MPGNKVHARAGRRLGPGAGHDGEDWRGVCIIMAVQRMAAMITR
jgi:hypothetical protein